MSVELQSVAESAVQKYIQILQKSDFSLNAIPSVSLDQRGAVAGSALLQKNHIRLNKALMVQNESYFIEQVIPHEVAHLAVYAHFGRVRPHGKEWQYIMRNIFKVSAERCHQLNIDKIGIKTFDYRCECGIAQLSIRRHNKVVKGAMRYICKQCRHTLTAV